MAYDLQVTNNAALVIDVTGVDITIGTFSQTASNVASSHVGAASEVPAANAGVLSTRTDNDTGVLTIVGTNDFSVSDKVSVAWQDDDGVWFARQQMNVTASAGQLVTVDAGAGDNLPVVDSDIIISELVVEAFPVDNSADVVEGATVQSTQPGMAVFYSDSTTIVGSRVLLQAAGSAIYATSIEALAFPFGTNVVTLVKFANFSTTSAADMRADAILN